MKVHNVVQGSYEWQRLRLGIPTASEFDRILTPLGKPSKQATAFCHFLIAERIIGEPLDRVQTSWMQRGHELEAQAVTAYELQNGVETEKVGFITTDCGTVGASPDRLVGTSGLLEVKAPKPETHVRYMIEGCVDQDYYPQIQGQLLVADRQWTDILSYCPGFPNVIIRVERDEKYLSQLTQALYDFVADLESTWAHLSARYDLTTPPAQKGGGDFDLTDADVDAILAARGAA